jgi:hypothetical protein
VPVRVAVMVWACRVTAKRASHRRRMALVYSRDDASAQNCCDFKRVGKVL